MQSKNHFMSGICAGYLIGVGGFAYLRFASFLAHLEDKVLAAFLFSFGLFFIIEKSLSLFTGKTGYTFDGGVPWYYTKTTLLPTLLGNLFGTCLCAIFSICANESISDYAKWVIDSKAQANLFSLFMSSFFCGLIMYLTVDVAKKKEGAERIFTILIGVMGFILCGFNHSIADSYYMFASGDFSYIPRLALTVIGNFVGGIFLPLFEMGLEDE